MMVWFYTRDGYVLRLESHADHQTRAYVGILTFPNGHQDRHRFQTARAFRDWLVTIDRQLLAAKWTQQGSPQILPDERLNTTLPSA